MSKYSALSMSLLLIFEIQFKNVALFLRANFSSYAALFGSVTLIVPLTSISHHCNHTNLVVTLVF